MRSDGNRPFSYSRYRTGTSLKVRLMRGSFSNANYIQLFIMIFPRISLHCMLVPVQYREYENGLLDKQVWEPFLKTGIILANFISEGTIPDKKEALKIISSGFDRTVFKRFRISTDIQKGPVDLPDFCLEISSSFEEIIVVTESLLRAARMPPIKQ